MSDLAVLVPVLNRPGRVEPTLSGFHRTAPGCRVLFIADADDNDELAALHAAGAEVISPGGSYAAKIRAGVEATDELLVFLGADDLEPIPGWFEAARDAMTGGIEVVGINDLLRRRRSRSEHATHFLMSRAYAELPAIDGSPGPLATHYIHSCVDDELIATATARGVYAYAQDAHVKHLHWMNREAEVDSTYQVGIDTIEMDRALFERRKALWA